MHGKGGRKEEGRIEGSNERRTNERTNERTHPCGPCALDHPFLGTLWATKGAPDGIVTAGSTVAVLVLFFNSRQSQCLLRTWWSRHSLTHIILSASLVVLIGWMDAHLTALRTTAAVTSTNQPTTTKEEKAQEQEQEEHLEQQHEMNPLLVLQPLPLFVFAPWQL